MGQYLAIGIVTSFSVLKDELASARMMRDELEAKIVIEQDYNHLLFEVI